MRHFSKILLLILSSVKTAWLHGMLMDPVNRASLWRFDPSAPVDYNDNEGFCGGAFNQWTTHGGKCGLCGDDYGLPLPRPHEHGGLYGNGTIVKTYKTNTIHVGVLITANHLGHFLFDLCRMDGDSNESEKCFSEHRLKLVTGEDRLNVQNPNPGWFNTTLSLPANLACKHCVLRWTYVAGNSWGTCENGTEAIGCGSQEHFRSCSDIAILADVQLELEDIPGNVLPEEFIER